MERMQGVAIYVLCFGRNPADFRGARRVTARIRGEGVFFKCKSLLESGIGTDKIEAAEDLR